MFLTTNRGLPIVMEVPRLIMFLINVVTTIYMSFYRKGIFSFREQKKTDDQKICDSFLCPGTWFYAYVSLLNICVGPLGVQSRLSMRECSSQYVK